MYGVAYSQCSIKQLYICYMYIYCKLYFISFRAISSLTILHTHTYIYCFVLLQCWKQNIQSVLRVIFTTRKLYPVVQPVQQANSVKKNKKKLKKNPPPPTTQGKDGVRLSEILSSSGPVSIKGNNHNGQHRFKTELQESGDSADNQNTGTLASKTLKEGLCRESR